jgi:hypothetical protein
MGVARRRVAVVATSVDVRSARADAGMRAVFLARCATHLGVAALLLVAGVTTLAGSGWSVYWLVPAALGALGVGILDASVLLIGVVR